MITALAPQTIRVVLADDHDFVRMGIKALLSTIGGVEVVGEARDGVELVALLADLTADVVLTDISMPGMDGISAIAEIHDNYPQVKVLVLSMHDSVDFVKQAIGKGACGYLMKDAPSFELEQALRSVMVTGSYFSPSISQRLLQPSAPTAGEQLTPRQLEILTLLAKGHTAKEIAHQLGLSSKTVDVHRAHIMERLQLHDIASLTKYAVREGLITL